MFGTIAELIEIAEKENKKISDVVIDWEEKINFTDRATQWEAMEHSWMVMKESIERGVHNTERSLSGLTGGDANKLANYKGKNYTGSDIFSVAAWAIGVAEVNAVMGRIVACPTAGSCGIVPAALMAAQIKNGNTDEEIVKALFTVAGIGMVVEQNASIAGAFGGCQAECGTAAGMAAAALVELAGGTPAMAGHAVALAIKNLLGLACDPVAGLVEVPCVKRNGFITVQAMLAADMALAGIESVIPVDEVIDAMDRIGREMPCSIKETAEGGLATTETGKLIAYKVFGVSK